MNATSNNAHLSAQRAKLPVGGLLVLSLCGFVTLMTEVMPAGLLPEMSQGLGVSQGTAGQLVTAYALGSTITAIPLMVFTQAISRRALLLGAIIGFAVVNAVTALSGEYWLILAARVLAGMFGGAVWALLVGYAVRMSPPNLSGRAIAIAGAGAPLALSLGVPAGTFFGTHLDWRVTFGLMSLLALLLALCILAKLADFPGQPGSRSHSVRQVVMIPGLARIFFLMCSFVLAHNVLYTYVAPFLTLSGLSGNVDLVLLFFGIAGMVGLWGAGALLDRFLGPMVRYGFLILAVVALLLGFLGDSAVPVAWGVAIWGLIAGGAPVLFQTAEARAAGDATDVAQAMFVTLWNLGVAAGSALGGLLLERLGAQVLAWAFLALILPAILVSWQTRDRA